MSEVPQILARISYIQLESGASREFKASSWDGPVVLGLSISSNPYFKFGVH